MHTMSQRICMRHTTFHYMYNYIRIRGGTQGAREEGVGRKGGQKARENESVCVGGIFFRLLTLRITYNSTLLHRRVQVVAEGVAIRGKKEMNGVDGEEGQGRLKVVYIM